MSTWQKAIDLSATQKLIKDFEPTEIMFYSEPEFTSTLCRKDNDMGKIQFSVNMGLTNDEEILLQLADDMASAMTDLNPQNYKEFIDARDKFRDKIRDIVGQTRKNEERLRKMKEFIEAA